MKMTRRIFIALLILAVTVSSLAVFASANETGLSVQDYVNVLEYYEEQSLVDYDFSVDTEYSALLTNSTRAAQYVHSIVADAAAPGGKYLSLAIKERSGRSAYTDNHAYFAWTSSEAIDDFNVDMTVSGQKYNSNSSENDENLPRIIIVVGESQFTNIANAKTAGVTIAAVDYNSGYFSYLKGTDTEYKTSYRIEEGKWYNVSLTYDADNGVSITITEVGNLENTLTVTDGYVPYTTVRDIRVGAHGEDGTSARGTLVKYAGVRIQGGVYHREMSNMQADIEEKILSMYNYFLDDEAAIEDKVTICSVAGKLNEYGFTTDKADVQKALEDLGVGMVGLYNSKIEEFVVTLDTYDNFAAKKAYVEQITTYANSLANLDMTGISEELVEKTEKNLKDFREVKAKFDASEADSVKFLELVAAIDCDLDNYAQVKANLELFEGCNPDLTYEGVAESYKRYNNLVLAEKTIRTSAEAFIAAVQTANNAELDFNTRAEAYKNMTYFDNETYPGVTEALAGYEAVRDYLNAEISYAENFIKYVNKADYASYISAKQENLDIAKGYMEICQPDFAGVAEAKVLYAEVKAFVEQQLANANAYISAVNALDNLTGAALTNGIKNAQSLQQAGNVLGVEGVTEANIKLNQIVASIELVERYCIHFINLVNSLDKATDVAATYEILANAKAAEADADKSYAGVSDASAKLSKAIADINAQIEAINSEFEKANDVAANTCGVGENDNAVCGQVIALVKKFFDEE